MSNEITNRFETSWALGLLGALQGKHVYEGTVPEHVVTRRRARNKAARASRKTNRR